MRDLDRKIADFAAQGVEVIALSTDDRERARDTQDAWGLENTRIGYGISIENARAWGLYISAGVGKTSTGHEEPALFSEPGLFLVRPDGTLYFATTQTMPFARPAFADILSAVGFVVDRNYPARGEIVDHHAGENQAAE